MAALMQRADTVAMSTINLCETLVLAADRYEVDVATVAGLLAPFAIEQVAPDVETATLAAIARLRHPLNLGDCFAYALARLRNEPLLTLDEDFARTDVKLVPYSTPKRPGKK